MEVLVHFVSQGRRLVPPLMTLLVDCGLQDEEGNGGRGYLSEDKVGANSFLLSSSGQD